VAAGARRSADARAVADATGATAMETTGAVE
jgi:hypothetical protein